MRFDFGLLVVEFIFLLIDVYLLYILRKDANLPNFSLDKEFSLRIGKKAKLNGGDFIVELTSISKPIIVNPITDTVSEPHIAEISIFKKNLRNNYVMKETSYVNESSVKLKDYTVKLIYINEYESEVGLIVMKTK